MAILKVARMGHPVLRQTCRELSVAEIRSEPIQRLVQDMMETMVEYGGVGLAAPQVHEPIRLAVLELSEDNPRYEVDEPALPLVLFNARVEVLDAELEGFWEGCLSVPGLRGYVERPRQVAVDFLDGEGKARHIEADGFLATVLQHELDHLDGVLYVDKLADPHKFAFTDEYARYLMEEAGDMEEG